MRSEFEKWFKTSRSYLILKEANYYDLDLFEFNESYQRYVHSGVQIAFETWQHQQSKVDELQKQLNERDLRIKRLIESEENIARGCESWRNACSKLWKTEDAVKQLIQVYKDEEKELELTEWEQSTIYGRIAIELEQALKGGGE